MKKWTPLLLLASLLMLFSSAYGNDKREIKILRQTPSAFDRAISDHLCMSYEVIHPYHRCQEVFLEQGKLTRKERAEYDFIITSEQFFNEQLKQDFQLVLPLYHQAFTVVTRDITQDNLFKSGQKYGVLQQKVQENVLADVLKAMNIDAKRLSLQYLESQELIDRFCSFDINVAFVTGAHPNRIVRQLNTLCDGEPISIVQDLPKSFFQRHRYFYQTHVPKELYWRLPNDIETLSVRYLLAVNNKIAEDNLDELMESFIKELEYNRSLPMTEASILLNYNNLQTPLHDVGGELMEELQEEQDALELEAIEAQADER